MIEIMLVLAIVGLLLALAVPFYQTYSEKAEATQAINDIGTIAKQIELFKSVHGRYPDSLADVFMDELKDPWGNAYQYLNIETAKGKGKLRKDRNLVPINTDFDLYSMGPDGKTTGPLTASASKDDIIRAGNGGYVGIAEDY